MGIILLDIEKERDNSSQGASSGGFFFGRLFEGMIRNMKDLPITFKTQIVILIVSLLLLASISLLYSDFDEDGINNVQEMRLDTDIFEKDTSGDGIEDGEAHRYMIDPSKSYPSYFVSIFDKLKTIDEKTTKQFALTILKDDEVSIEEIEFFDEYMLFRQNYPSYFINVSEAIFVDYEISDYEIGFLEDLNKLTSEMEKKNDVIPSRYLNDSRLSKREARYVSYLMDHNAIKNPILSVGGRLSSNELIYIEMLNDNPNNIRAQILQYSYHKDGIIDWRESWNIKDPDKDGLITIKEEEIGTDFNKSDTDEDGLCDGDEFLAYHTDPLSQDTDEDRLSDEEEIMSYYTNPLEKDSDGDNLIDGEEVLDYNSDPNEKDIDLYRIKVNLTQRDGSIDDREREYLRLLASDRLNISKQILDYGPHIDGILTEEELENSRDRDSDGVIKIVEEKIGTDPDNSDTDRDGLLDGWEIYSFQRKGFKPVPLVEYGANPLHKDIFIEVIGEEKMSENTKKTIISTFANAPVSNPDGDDGITLHIDDDTPGFSLGGENAKISEYDQNKVGNEHPRYGLFYFCKVTELDGWGGYGDVPGYNFMIDSDFINRGEYFFHEIGHNILGWIDEENRIDIDDTIHSKYPGYAMYSAPTKVNYHPTTWNQIERDGIEGLPRLKEKFDWKRIEWGVSYGSE